MSPAQVCTPLRVEQWALRGTLTSAPLRTGMGPARSVASEPRLTPATGILVAGLGGAVGSGVRPGDVVVGTEGRDSEERWASPSATLLAPALRRCGLTVHLGPIASMPRIVHGAARARLASTGALAVDMEAAQLAAVAGNRPFAVLRAIVDTPDAPLLRPATLSRGLRGLRALRVAAPAIEQWTAALGRRELVILAARGVAPQMRREAMARGLRVVDATRRDEICYATTNRQQAVRSIAAEADLVLVVGSRHSSNSLRLVEVAERLGTPAYLVDGVEDVDLAWLAGASSVGITAGASAPENLVEQIITSLSGLGPVSVRESDVVHEDVEFTMPKEVI